MNSPAIVLLIIGIMLTLILVLWRRYAYVGRYRLPRIGVLVGLLFSLVPVLGFILSIVYTIISVIFFREGLRQDSKFINYWIN